MPEYQNWTFENYDVDFKNAAAFEACVKFSKTPYNLYLYGTAGNGKSRLSWAAAFKYFKENRAQGKQTQMVFLPIAEFANRAIEAKKGNSKDFLKGLLRKDIVVLDDLEQRSCQKVELTL
ncbi:DNA replication protein DnaC [Elusimicrobium posterum]|uniref:DnaA ATPase domain-containing protein n=1 Tax=Elusimicrobium posterum TaxID=3116653 RepID=UPI003C77582E